MHLENAMWLWTGFQRMGRIERVRYLCRYICICGVSNPFSNHDMHMYVCVHISYDK